MMPSSTVGPRGFGGQKGGEQVSAKAPDRRGGKVTDADALEHALSGYYFERTQ